MDHGLRAFGRVWAAVTFGVCSAVAAADRKNPIALVQQSPSIAAVRDIGGFVGDRIRSNAFGSVMAFNIDQYTRVVEERRHREWSWVAGEQPGKWLESAVLTSRQSGDGELEERARQILARLEASQGPDGYLGVTDPAVRTAAQPLRGMDAYELYFMLHGLLTAAEEWGDSKALESAKKLGDYFVAHIGPGKAEFWPSPLRPPANVNTIICPQYAWVPEGTPRSPTLYEHAEIAGHTAHAGWEGTLLIDPMMRLCQKTGDARYLEWCQWVVSNIDRWSGWNAFSKLDQVADGTLGVHQLQPYVHSHTFQMNFLGFLRLYRVTGDASYLRKVRGAWDDVAKRQLYITGGVSVREHYEPGYHRPLDGEVVETCANMSWLELTQALLELSGEARYADAIERLLFNHVFASQTVDGDCYRYHTPPNGFKPEKYFHGPDCCTASGHRIVSMLPRFFYAEGPAGLYVNQYVQSAARLKTPDGVAVALKVETRYPEEETVKIRVEPERKARFALHVRLPAWCEAPRVAVNGAAVPQGPGGGYARLERAWSPGDVVTLELPMQPRWVEHDHWDGGQAPWALVRGPVVYALDTVWWSDPSVAVPYDVFREVAALPDSSELRPAPAAAGSLGPFYEAKVQHIGGQPVRVRMVPFANMGRWYRKGEAKPDRHGRAFSYAVWLQSGRAQEFAAAAESYQRNREVARTSYDYVLIGDDKSEREHRQAGTGNAGRFRERMYRHAGNGGWFSYELRVPTEKPAQLAVTYWGGEPDPRIFDVMVNDRVLATETLHQNKPGEFFEVRYPIPFELIEGKTDALGQKVDRVTVKFKGQGQKTAGGVFGLRVVAQ